MIFAPQESPARPGDNRAWADLQHRMEEPIPPVAPETVRHAAIAVVERFGSDSGEVLGMLGITTETLAEGMLGSGRESAA